MSPTSGYIYLVHFERPYQHARHYLGWTQDLHQRFYRHTARSPIRRGSALMRAVVQAGIGFKVVRVWNGTRDNERNLHRNSHTRRCPVCRGEIDYAAAPDLLKEST